MWYGTMIMLATNLLALLRRHFIDASSINWNVRLGLLLLFLPWSAPRLLLGDNQRRLNRFGGIVRWLLLTFVDGYGSIGVGNAIGDNVAESATKLTDRFAREESVDAH